MKSILKSVLKTGLDLLERSEHAATNAREESKARFSEVAEKARSVVKKHEDHTLRNAITLASGVALGIGVALLFAPASGEQIRSSIEAKAQALRDQMSERFSSKTTAEDERVASGQ